MNATKTTATIIKHSRLTEEEARVLTTPRGRYRYARFASGKIVRYAKVGNEWVSQN